MDAGTWSILLSGLAVVVSAGAVYFTRRQATAAEEQVKEARRAADIAEAASRDAKAADLETRLRSDLSIAIAGNDPVNLLATVKSVHPERLAKVTIALLPVQDEPVVGFRSDDDQSLEAFWNMQGLAPGETEECRVMDLRKDSPPTAEVKWIVTESDVSCSWTTTVPIHYPPSVYVF